MVILELWLYRIIQGLMDKINNKKIKIKGIIWKIIKISLNPQYFKLFIEKINSFSLFKWEK